MDFEDGLTIEDLGRRGFKVLQIKDGFKFGTDSVLLGWFASSFVRKSKRDVSFLELGSNTGAVSLCVAARLENVSVDSVEIMPREAEVLQRNIELNNLQNRMRGFNADIRNLPSEVKNKQYNVVLFNPPYFNENNGPAATNKDGALGSRGEGRFELNGDMNDFVKAASSRVIPSSGYVCMVMHGSRLTDAINSFINNGLKPAKLIMVHSFEDRNASAFLLAGKKGTSGSDINVLPPLFLNVRNKETGDIMASEKIIEIYEKEHSDCFI